MGKEKGNNNPHEHLNSAKYAVRSTSRI